MYVAIFKENFYSCCHHSWQQKFKIEKRVLPPRSITKLFQFSFSFFVNICCATVFVLQSLICHSIVQDISLLVVECLNSDEWRILQMLYGWLVVAFAQQDIYFRSNISLAVKCHDVQKISFFLPEVFGF